MNVNSNLPPYNEDDRLEKLKWIAIDFLKNWKENVFKYIVLFVPFLFGISKFSTWIEKHNVIFWLLFLLVAFGIIVNIYLEGSTLGKKENEIHRLTVRNSTLEQDALRNQDYIDSMKESIESVPDEIIEHIFHFLELGNDDRISLYSFDKDKLYMTGRYSSSPELKAQGRLIYPKNEGYIGKVWNGVEDDLYIVENLDDPTRAKRKYLKQVCKDSNLSEDIVSKLSMKSRSYYIRLLRKGHREVAVLVLESKKENLPKSKNQIDDVLNGEFGKLLVMYVNRINMRRERKAV